MAPMETNTEIRGLMGLPTEILFQIFQHLGKEELQNALVIHRDLTIIPRACLAYRDAKAGGPALFRACFDGDLFTAEMLIKFGLSVEAYRRPADIVRPTFNCTSPLVYAIAGGRIEVVKFLVARGAHVSAIPFPLHRPRMAGGMEGWYPIHWAVGLSTNAGDSAGVAAAREEIVSFLLEQGAVVDQPSHTFSLHARPVTPFDVAESSKASKKIVRLLEEKRDQTRVAQDLGAKSLEDWVQLSALGEARVPGQPLRVNDSLKPDLLGF